MALPTQYARLVINTLDLSAKTIQNIFWYELIGAFPSNYDANAAAVAVEGAWHTQLLNWMSADALYLGVDVRINNNGVTTDASTFRQDSGSAAAGVIPNEVAAIVHWQTAQPGGSGRGRSFFTLCPAAFSQGGRLSSSGNAILVLLAAALNGPIVNQGISWQLRLYSRTRNEMFPMASHVVDAVFGTQRRRRPIR